MKKYLLAQGYKFKEAYNDMIHKQFFLMGIVYENSITTTMGGFQLDRTESYILFLKEVDGASFKTSLESILDAAIKDGVSATLANSVTVENVENGYNITMNFKIQG